MKYLALIFLLFSTSYADIVVIKIGSRGLNNGNLTWDWRSGQIVDILTDNTPISDHMKTHFLVAKVNKVFTDEERRLYLSPVYDENDKLIRRRNFYIPFDSLPGMTAKKLQTIYDKNTDNGIIDLTSYNIDNFLKDTRVITQTTSNYDKGGSISEGFYTIGTGQNYASISAFEADLAANLTGSVTGQINANYRDTTAVSFAGFVTFSTCPVIINVAPSYRHSGKWDGSKSSCTPANYTTMFSMASIGYITLDGLQITLPATANNTGCIYLNSNTKPCIIKNCIFTGKINGTYCDTYASFIKITGTEVNQIYNNILYDCKYNAGHDGAIFGYYGGKSVVANNTIYAVTNGIQRQNGANGLVLKNNLISETTTCYVGSFDATSSSNTSSDATSPNPDFRGKNPTFTNASNGDFSLSSADSVAIDKGMAVSGFSTDIIGTTRPQGSAWDIGAFEYVSGVTPTPAYIFPANRNQVIQ